MSFAGLFHDVAAGRGKKVTVGEVYQALGAINNTTKMDTGVYPLFGKNEKYYSAIRTMLDGFRKHNPPVKKMTPVEVDLPELV